MPKQKPAARKNKSSPASSAPATRMRRNVLRQFDSTEQAEQADREYWWAQTPAYRLRALERLRQRNYGYGQGQPLPRFQRTIRIIELGGK